MNESELFNQVLQLLLQSKYDNKSTSNEDYAKQLKNVHTEFVKRNEKLTGLLEDYIQHRKERIKTNDSLKKFIFWLFVALLIVLTIVVVIVFVKTDLNSSDVSSAVSLISVALTYLGSLISIFKIMSTYLFPVDEEKDTIEMIKTVIENDIQVEQLMSQTIQDYEDSDIKKIQTLKQLHDSGALDENEFKELKVTFIDKIKEKGNSNA